LSSQLKNEGSSNLTSSPLPTRCNEQKSSKQCSN